MWKQLAKGQAGLRNSDRIRLQAVGVGNSSTEGMMPGGILKHEGFPR